MGGSGELTAAVRSSAERSCRRRVMNALWMDGGFDLAFFWRDLFKGRAAEITAVSKFFLAAGVRCCGGASHWSNCASPVKPPLKIFPCNLENLRCRSFRE